MKARIGFALAVAALLMVVLISESPPAGATTVGVSVRSGLAANDQIDWSAVGPAFTALGNPFTVVSGKGIEATVSEPVGSFERRNETTGGWSGIFSTGDALLWTGFVPTSSVPQIVVTLDSPVRGVGAQIQADAGGAFLAFMDVFHGATLLATIAQSGVNHLGDVEFLGTAPFLGALSDAFEIDRVVFRVQHGAAPDDGDDDFAINRVSLVTVEGPSSSVPVPAALGLLAAAFSARALRAAHRTPRLLGRRIRPRARIALHHTQDMLVLAVALQTVL